MDESLHRLSLQKIVRHSFPLRQPQHFLQVQLQLNDILVIRCRCQNPWNSHRKSHFLTHSSKMFPQLHHFTTNMQPTRPNERYVHLRRRRIFFIYTSFTVDGCT